MHCCSRICCTWILLSWREINSFESTRWFVFLTTVSAHLTGHFLCEHVCRWRTNPDFQIQLRGRLLIQCVADFRQTRLERPNDSMFIHRLRGFFVWQGVSTNSVKSSTLWGSIVASSYPRCPVVIGDGVEVEGDHGNGYGPKYPVEWLEPENHSP